MGEDLILFAVEIGGKKQQPKWKRGADLVAAMTEQELLVVWHDRNGGETDEDHPELAEQVRRQLLHALQQLEDAWNGDHRYGCILHFRRSRVLAMGGVSWGDDPFEGYEDVDLLSYAGDLLEQVGFR
jgi:hypothetical protein